MVFATARVERGKRSFWFSRFLYESAVVNADLCEMRVAPSWTERACQVRCFKVAVVVRFAFCYSAWGCDGDFAPCPVFQAEQVALPVFFVFTVVFFHSAEEVYVGHDFQQRQQFLEVSFFKFAYACVELLQLGRFQVSSSQKYVACVVLYSGRGCAREVFEFGFRGVLFFGRRE